MTEEMSNLHDHILEVDQLRLERDRALASAKIAETTLRKIAQPLMDDQLEALIEVSDGRWVDGEFRIDGPDLMNLLRSAYIVVNT